MNADSFYIKGSTHRENQDYAAHGIAPYYAVVSDGCSSAPKSDFGSRLLVQSAIRFLGQAGYNDDSFRHSTINTARIWSNAVGLSDDALCATLLVATIDEQMYKVFVSGDGFVIARCNDRMEIYEYRFARGAPCYLRYSLDSKITKDYWEKFGKEVKYKTYFINNSEVEYKEETIEHADAPFFFKKEFPIAHYSWVAVMSDGGSSFVKMLNHGTSIEPVEVTIPEIMGELFSFKNFQGEFVQRRCSKAFKEFAKKNWHNSDDVSLAVISRDGKP